MSTTSLPPQAFETSAKPSSPKRLYRPVLFESIMVSKELPPGFLSESTPPITSVPHPADSGTERDLSLSTSTPPLYEPVIFNRNAPPGYIVEATASISSKQDVAAPSLVVSPTEIPTNSPTGKSAVLPSNKEEKQSAKKNAVDECRITAYDVAELLRKKLPLRLLNGGLYYFDGRCFKFVTQDVMHRLIMRQCRQYVRTVGNASLIKQIYELIRAEPDIVIDESDVDTSVVALENGLLRLADGKLLPHTPQIFTTARIKGRYLSPSQRHCPRFYSFLNVATNGDPMLQQRIWEVIGYTLVPDTKGKCFFLFQGVPNSGKSLLGDFLAGCFEADQVTSLDVETFGRQFGPSELLGKRLCLSMDLAAAPWDAKAIGVLKRLTGNDQITADVKYQPHVKFRNNATLLFGSNHAVTTSVRDDAFLQRLVVVPFRFSVPKERQEWNLLEQLQREQDSIISEAIDHYVTLRKHNYIFAGTYRVNEVVASNRAIAVSLDQAVADFFSSSCTLSPSGEVFVEDLHQIFLEQYPEFSDIVAFSTKFYAFCDVIHPGRVEKRRKRKPGAKNPTSVFVGIKLLGVE